MREDERKVGCPLCSIPQRERMIYADESMYLVSTSKMKGHDVRVMACIFDHRQQPTFEERTRAYYLLVRYMEETMKNTPWFIVDGTQATITDHFHLIACDGKGTNDELRQLDLTPKVAFPLPTEKWNTVGEPSSKVLIVVPAFNEEEHIAEVVDKARKYGTVLVVDDGSKDNTATVARDHGAEVLEVGMNLGYGSALRFGFEFAKWNGYKVLVTLDGDGQHNPDEIPLFLEAIEGYDMVVGNRYHGGSAIPAYRRAGLAVVNRLKGVGDSQCGFRAYGRKAIESIDIKEKGMQASLELLDEASKHGLQVTEVPCTVSYEEGRHSEAPIKQGAGLLERVLWNSIWVHPVRTLWAPAFLLIIMGSAFGFMLVDAYIQSHYFVLSLGVLSLGFMLAGILMIVVGVLLHFIRRSFIELGKNKP